MCSKSERQVRARFLLPISRPRALSGCDRREERVGIPDVEENQRRALFWLLGARLREVHEHDIAKLIDCHIWRPQGRKLI